MSFGDDIQCCQLLRRKEVSG